MKKFILTTPLLFLFFNGFIFAQNTGVNIYPNVKKITSKGATLPFNGFKLAHSKWNSLVERSGLKDNLTTESKSWELNIGINRDNIASKNGKKISNEEGAYYLKINKGEIILAAKDSIGVFYGLQTLRQLIKDKQITSAEVSDFPTVKYRGVVEGFYGTPWSQEDRISQLKFYGTIKANTYIYGPKDDPYHSSPNWRKPYPEDEAQKIKELVKVARQNYVNFVWAIHPGQDIKWTDEDQNNVIKKFEAMYNLGVRSFAVFFDDISGEGTNAQKQAGLLNLINEKFVKVKKDVLPLMMCPTEYNKSWANPKPDGYLTVLGKALDPSIQIMWTGDKVVDDINKGTLQWVQERIKRPALVWWNFPVSDYVRAHLLLGASYGLENGINATQMAGILSNPMEHAEASKVAIFGLADYAWNTAAYASNQSWKAGIKTLMPNSFEAYQIFAENNADPGKNGHKYRREESTTIQPYINKIYKKTATADDFKFVENYFQQISTAANTIEKANDNPALIKDIKPWLDDFTTLGLSGLSEIKNYKTEPIKNPELFWATITNTPNFDKDKNVPKNKNTIIPTTGNTILKPFVDSLKTQNNSKLISSISGQKNIKPTQATIGTFTTQIAALKNLKLITGDKNEIALQPILEVFEIQPNESFTIHLTQTLNNAEIRAKIDNEDLNWALIEVSQDGERWVSPSRFDQGTEIISVVDEKPFEYIKFENIALDPVKLKLSKFSILNTGESTANEQYKLRDNNVYTAFTLQAKQTVTDACPITNAQKVVLLTQSDNSPLLLKIQNATGEWQEITHKNGNYIEIPIKDKCKALQIQSNQTIKINEIIWK